MNNEYANDFEVRLATLEKLGGDASIPQNIYECDLEILARTGQGGGGAAIVDSAITSGTTWSSSKINSEILSAISVGFKIEIVEELPATGLPKVLYLVPKTGATTGDVYDEYVYVNGAWEKIGSTAVDLSNYYTKGQVDSAISTAKSEAQIASSAYTDEKIAAEVTARDGAIATAKSEAVGAASGYTDQQITAEVGNRNSAIATAKSEAIAAAELASSAYTDEKIQALSAATVTALGTKQDTLVSATNIKTINDQSLLGSGNIEIQGGGGGAAIIDSGISSASTWSSQKVYNEVTDDEEVIASALFDLDNRFNVMNENLTGITKNKVLTRELETTSKIYMGDYLNVSDSIKQIVLGKNNAREDDAYFVIGGSNSMFSNYNIYSIKNNGNTIQSGSSQASEFKLPSGEKAVVGTNTEAQLRVWTGTENEYEEIAVKDNNTVYILKEE